MASTSSSSLVLSPHFFVGFCRTKPSSFSPHTASLPLVSLAFPFRPQKYSSLSFVSFAKGKKSTVGDLEDLRKKNEAMGEEEELEDIPWLEEKAMDLVEFSGTVTEAIPGPRVGESKLPWILAVPLAYIGITFVLAFVRTVKKLRSPKTMKKRQVNKNVTLLKDLDGLFSKNNASQLQYSDLKELMKKTGFTVDEILRKYIRYVLNEKPFNPNVVVDLISLRKVSQLNDTEVAEVLNEISRRIVKDKGPVVMDISGFTEKGFKRKLAVQTLFGKILYLSELPELCSRESSLIVKEIFGVTDNDAESLRMHTLSESGDMESVEKMVDSSEGEEGLSNAPASTS
ncbi:hypothetical protein ZOSMA_4G01360 [Zostera marina]|uniref:Armadillo-like repeats domain-containing protein n=1 Tax=Zostera marina TaxID=29655 RepID=A0A0K9P0T4_ZOSMR|nr:hypothetical protein ZOSMA_4G01360 [Zostera marina]